MTITTLKCDCLFCILSYASGKRIFLMIQNIFPDRIFRQICSEVDVSIQQRRFLTEFRLSGFPLLSDKLEKFLTILVQWLCTLFAFPCLGEYSWCATATNGLQGWLLLPFNFNVSRKMIMMMLRFTRPRLSTSFKILWRL